MIAELTEPETTTGFHALNLIQPLIESLDRAGYLEPSPIQAALIPVALTGRDVLGQAQTGTGKTAAFLLPFMNRWRGGDPSRPQALVLAPTRELAVQVAEECEKLAPSRHFKTVAIYGGQRFGSQLTKLRKGCTIVVGTPGRVLDHLTRGTITMEKVRYLVLDEADRMLDIGFRPQIERIMRRVPEGRQTLMMSATLPADVVKLKKRYMIDPEHVNVSPDVLTVEKIDQKYITVDEDRKNRRIWSRRTCRANDHDQMILRPRDVAHAAGPGIDRLCSAGAIVLEHYTQEITARRKEDRSPVTDADEEAERFILKRLARLRRMFPSSPRKKPRPGACPRSATTSSWSIRWTAPRSSSAAMASSP